MAPLEIVDAHHHLWDLGGALRYPWLADGTHATFLGDYAALRRDYLPEDYRRDARNQRVIATVHVEAECDRSQQLAETEWLAGVHARSGMPSAIVAHAWLDTPDTERVLAAQAACPLVRGIRSKPVTAPSPDRTAALPRGAPRSLSDPRWREGLALLERFGLSWDLRIPYWHLAEAAEVAAAVPGIPIALNHTGFPWDRSPAGLAHWRDGMRALAACPNVHVKISELSVRGRAWRDEDHRPVVRDTLDIFGVERCMVASNFPVAGLHAGFDQFFDSLARMVADLSRADQERLFSRNALRFYRIAA
jgi:predicted TIM-barrel fold metal-dependent hydrolase